MDCIGLPVNAILRLVIRVGCQLPGDNMDSPDNCGEPFMIPIAYPLLGEEEESAILRVLASNQWAHLARLDLFYEQRIAHARFLTADLSNFIQTPVSRTRHRHVHHLPVMEAAAREVLSPPMHPSLSEENHSTIVREVLALCD
jgi:dTDP-4-amino-4,6-dideoxygalactose transaminase